MKMKYVRQLDANKALDVRIGTWIDIENDVEWYGVEANMKYGLWVTVAGNEPPQAPTPLLFGSRGGANGWCKAWRKHRDARNATTRT